MANPKASLHFAADQHITKTQSLEYHFPFSIETSRTRFPPDDDDAMQCNAMYYRRYAEPVLCACACVYVMCAPLRECVYRGKE